MNDETNKTYAFVEFPDSRSLKMNEGHVRRENGTNKQFRLKKLGSSEETCWGISAATCLRPPNGDHTVILSIMSGDLVRSDHSFFNLLGSIRVHGRFGYLSGSIRHDSFSCGGGSRCVGYGLRGANGICHAADSIRIP
jgi:hypothetical protein